MILAGLSFLVAGMFLQRNSIPLFIVLILSGLIFLLLINRIYNATNEAISFLFDAIKNDDLTNRFHEKVRSKTLARVYESINRLNEHFQEIKLRNEYNESYYRTVVQHASAGLLILNANNRIELINKTACIYAGISAESTNKDLLMIKHPAFYNAVCNLRQGETLIYKNLVTGNLQLLLFRASMIRRKEEELKLISIQDIRNEMESMEIESYRKLISVLTHEIMNHLSPLTSVAKELQALLNKGEQNNTLPKEEDSVIETTINGLKLINEQSDGLVRFMNNYRKISKIPPPEYSSFAASEWVDQMKIAFSGMMKENNIEFTVMSDKSLKEIIADRKLLNQVMVNLVNNSVDAVIENKNERIIEIRIKNNRENRVVINITNNGPVIPPELLEKIFVPFFTTKKNGSGIGLSISQEIMKMHKGSIVALCSPDNLTSFIVEF